MAKKQASKNKKLLNTISGYILFYLGASMFFNYFTNLNSELGSSFVTIIFGVALIFLGIYVLRFERWAIILSGVYAIALVISMWVISKLIGGGLMIFLTNIPSYVLIINWWVSESK